MGEAKQRGSFEERKAKAVEQEKLLAQNLANDEKSFKKLVAYNKIFPNKRLTRLLSIAAILILITTQQQQQQNKDKDKE